MLEFFFVCDYIEYIKRNDQEELHEVRYRHLLLRHETPLPCWKIVAAWILGQVTWLPFKEAGRIDNFLTAYGPKAKKNIVLKPQTAFLNIVWLQRVGVISWFLKHAVQ